jgi:hypothetical protein
MLFLQYLQDKRIAPPIDRNFRPADGYLTTEEFLGFDGSIEPGRFTMKKFWIAVVGTALMFGPALYAQDVVTGVKDLSKDVDKGAKKTGDATKKAADKTADATVDASKATAKGTKKAAVATGDATKDASKDVCSRNQEGRRQDRRRHR